MHVPELRHLDMRSVSEVVLGWSGLLFERAELNGRSCFPQPRAFRSLNLKLGGTRRTVNDEHH
jgi:hypothetical protein